jgi:hypothetical protein
LTLCWSVIGKFQSNLCIPFVQKFSPYAENAEGKKCVYLRRRRKKKRKTTRGKTIVWETRKSRRDLRYRHVVKNTAALGHEKFLSQHNNNMRGGGKDIYFLLESLNSYSTTNTTFGVFRAINMFISNRPTDRPHQNNVWKAFRVSFVRHWDDRFPQRSTTIEIC